jgi:ethanolamine utilization protein EutQ (cupin superfamily)
MLVTSNQFSTDADKPVSAGFYRLEAGKELVYPYTYDEMKIILEGFPRTVLC